MWFICDELSPWEAKSRSASQKIYWLLWKSKVHYCVHKSPLLAPIPSQINPVHIPITYLKKTILILSSHLRLGLPSGLFTSGFRLILLCKSLLSHASFMPRPSYLLHLITLTIFCNEYNLWNSSLCYLFKSPFTSCLLGPIILWRH
jgi:hypothetical protein